MVSSSHQSVIIGQNVKILGQSAKTMSGSDSDEKQANVKKVWPSAYDTPGLTDEMKEKMDAIFAKLEAAQARCDGYALKCLIELAIQAGVPRCAELEAARNVFKSLYDYKFVKKELAEALVEVQVMDFSTIKRSSPDASLMFDKLMRARCLNSAARKLLVRGSDFHVHLSEFEVAVLENLVAQFARANDAIVEAAHKRKAAAEDMRKKEQL